MKRAIILLITIVLIPLVGFSQTTETFDNVSSFNEGFAAVKKGNQWAFINTEGEIVVNFRDDLVTTKTTDGEHPVFKNNRCLIVKKEKGISYFGFIDINGETVIQPTFLNATNFRDHLAIVLKMNKEKAGYNNVLGKEIVYYTYLEVLITAKGKLKESLSEPVKIVLSKKYFTKPPKITSKLISENLVIVKNKDQKWAIQKISN